ncbi:MAG: fibronectin type III-like domain-contianing protein, partial [Candidatus Aminicenantales bacterium]
GLSYTAFRYSNLRLSSPKIGTSESLNVEADVENCGRMTGDEVVQLYISDLEASVPVPIRQLSGFERISLNPGEKRTVSFTVTPRQLALIDASGTCVLEPGRFQISVGGGQPIKDDRLAAVNFLTAVVDVTGQPRELEY